MNQNNKYVSGVVDKLFFVAALSLLVTIRCIYWGNVSEIPFSDMADYIHWGERWADGDWMMKGQFWGAYKPPGVPLLYAGVFLLTSEQNVDHLRWLQLVILICALAFLAWQLVKESGTLFAGILLILVVTFSKSSVFWSFKAGTESLSEAMLYFSLGAAIWVNRDACNPYKYLMLAIATVFATFVRPNLLPLIGVLILFPFQKSFRVEKKRALRCLITYVMAVGCFWVPWIVRNYEHCGQFVPLSTQGPYSFFWELGAVDLTGTDGQRMVVNVNQLQVDAPKKFANDCQASSYAMSLVKLWVVENLEIYPDLIMRRLVRYTTDRQIDLTHISRTQLSPALDTYLFDKGKLQIVYAIVAGAILSLFYSWAGIFFASLTCSILFSALFMGDPRMFEPFIPLSLYLALAPAVALWQWIQRRYKAV